MLTSSEALWQPIITGVFTCWRVYRCGATCFMEQRMSQGRDRQRQEILGRLPASEVAGQSGASPGNLSDAGRAAPRSYQEEVWCEMLPRIALFRDRPISQIMAFYHALMGIEYLHKVNKARSTMYSLVIVGNG